MTSTLDMKIVAELMRDEIDAELQRRKLLRDEELEAELAEVDAALVPAQAEYDAALKVLRAAQAKSETLARQVAEHESLLIRKRFDRQKAGSVVSGLNGRRSEILMAKALRGEDDE